MSEGELQVSKCYKRLAFSTALVALLFFAVWETFGRFRGSGAPVSVSDQQEIIRTTLPVIRAIRAYEGANKRPPTSLADLVPRYLTRVPTPPDVSSGRDYLYGIEPNHWSIGVPVRDERDGVLTYSSNGKYPPGKPGMSVERIGDWAYYHGNPY